MRKPFVHLDFRARDRIEALCEKGHTQQEIAKILKVDKGTISRELKRKKQDGRYDAQRAEAKARLKRSRSKYQGMKVEAYPALKARIIRGLQEFRSPDEIAGRMKREGMSPRVGANAIYKWLYSPFGSRYARCLCTKRTRKKAQRRLPKRETVPNRVPLALRPSEGIHAEGDTLLSGRLSKASGFLASVPETKFLAGTLIPNRHAHVIEKAVKKSLRGIAVDTLTLDNGTENVRHEAFGLPTFFCDPHAPWQKPHVEDSIGLLRRWFIPKRTNLENVSEDQFQAYLRILNGKYRKSLAYQSAFEASLDRGIIKKVPVGTLATGVAFH